jgi:hypothetical protein
VDGRRRVGGEGDVHGLLRRLEAPSRISSVAQPPGVLVPPGVLDASKAMRIGSPVARLSALAARKGHLLEAPVQGDGKPARIASALALLRGACSESTECGCHLRPCRPPAMPRPCAGERAAAPSAGGPIAHGSHPEPSAPRAGSPARPSGVAGAGGDRRRVRSAREERASRCAAEAPEGRERPCVCAQPLHAVGGASTTRRLTRLARWRAARFTR